MTYHGLLTTQARHLVREAFTNAVANGASFADMTDEAIATDMCDCDCALEDFVWLGNTSGERDFSDNNFGFVKAAVGELRKEFGQ